MRILDFRFGKGELISIRNLQSEIRNEGPARYRRRF
jgi:hypothetical protein